GAPGDVGRHRERPPPERAHVLRGALGAVAVQLGDGYIGAQAGQLERRRAADAAARSGDDRDAAFEFVGHGPEVYRATTGRRAQLRVIRVIPGRRPRKLPLTPPSTTRSWPFT